MGAKRTNKVTVAAVVLVLGAALPLSSAQSADPKTSVAVDLDSQPLEAALVELSKQGHLQLVIATGSLPAKMSAPLHGSMSLGLALDLLLKDTGLTYKFVGDHTIAIAIVKSAGTTRQLSDPPASPGASGGNSPGTRNLDGNVDPGARDQNVIRGDLKVNHRSLMLRIAAFLGICVSTSVPGPACAQGSVASETGPLEEIIVTARRREENLQQVPIAVTVLSQQTLKDNNVQTIQDLQYLVPSLSLNSAAPNEGRLSLRGQGVSGNNGKPGVILYLNDVPVPDIEGVQSTGPGLLFDLENVQVLKGPQGTLFGKNSVGGDILLQSARPTSDFGGRIQLTYGNYSDREIDGAINIPIMNDVLLARIAFNGQLRDGYSHLQGEPSYPNGIDADNRSNWAVRGTLTFHPSDVFQNETIVTDSKSFSRGMFGILVEVIPGGKADVRGNFFAYLAQQQALGIRTSLPLSSDDVTNGGTLAVDNITRVSLTDTLTLRNIFGYDREEQILQADQDNTPFPLFDAPNNRRDTVLRQTSDELQLLGKSFDGRADWIVGAFYLDQPKPSDWVYQHTNVARVNNPGFSLSRTGQSSKALYAQDTLDLSSVIPHVKLTTGIRYTQDESSHSGRAADGDCIGPQNACAPESEIDSFAKSHALTWTAGLDYQVAPGTLLYLASRRGYRAGGFNGRNFITNLPQPGFGPEYVTDVELGIKSDWSIANIPIRTNADVWHQNYTDIQTQELLPGQLGTITQNAGSARLWGAEFEALAQLTEDLQFGVTYDHINLQYTTFNSYVPASTTAGLQATRTFNNPPNKYGLSARYHLPLPGDVGNVSVRANWTWQATSGDVSVANGFGVIPSFGLLNMSANWDGLFATPLDLSLFVSNALDKVYVINPVPSFEPATTGLFLGYGSEIFGEPRMYGIRIQYRFGGGAR